MSPPLKKHQILMSPSLNKHQVLVYLSLKKRQMQKTYILMNQHQMWKMNPLMKYIQEPILVVNLFTLHILWIKSKTMLVFL